MASLENDKKILEKENQLLEESCKLGQLQKEMLQDEQDKIHNLQHQEINKLKSMLMFREEASDKNATLHIIDVVVCLLYVYFSRKLLQPVKKTKQLNFKSKI